MNSVAARLFAHRREKIWLSVTLPLYFCLFYFTLQRVPFVEPVTLTPTPVDRAIPFDPRWTAVYQSLYLFLPLPWLCARRDDLERYRRAFLILTAIAFLVFLVKPVLGPRPSTPAPDGLYALLVTYDSNLNAFPSLHAGLTVLTFLLARRIVPRIVAGAAGAWSALILYSTMSTKQHWLVDVLAGVVLAVAADSIASRFPIRSEEVSYAPVAPPLRSSPGVDPELPGTGR